MTKFLQITMFLVLTIASLGGHAAVWLDGVEKISLLKAMQNAKDGSVILIGPGKHAFSGRLKANGVLIEGMADAALVNTAYKGKAAIVISGNNTTIKNLECYGIEVKSKNGACIRLQGKNLTLENVYFHDSEQGILTGKQPGTVTIRHSRFENLGKRGRAHGIYIGGGRLLIENSRFISAKDEGHEIKSRARETIIKDSIIASLDSDDSRLVDISNGGRLVIRDSLLQQGKKSANWNLIGYGMEGYKYDENSIELMNNLFLLDRVAGNRVLQIKNSKVKPTLSGNTFVGQAKDIELADKVFKSREAANLPAYPALPYRTKQAHFVQ